MTLQLASISGKRRTLRLWRCACLILVALAACCVTAAPGVCQEKEACPWLNSATAAGALEGPVVSTVKHTDKDKDDATCEFVRRQNSISATLRIEVETMSAVPADFARYAAQCGSNGTPVKAIGNEALACSFDNKSNKRSISEQVVGRVRDRAFVVRISSNAKPPDRTALRQHAQEIAEQVAGTLF